MDQSLPIYIGIFFSKMSDFIDCTKKFIFGYMHSEDVMKWVLL